MTTMAVTEGCLTSNDTEFFTLLWTFGGAGDSTKLLDIMSCGSLALDNTNSQFSNCQNLAITAFDAPDLTGTASLQSCFQNCDALTNIAAADLWDIFGVLNLESMFSGTASFNRDLVGWDTSNVPSMCGVFGGAVAFNQDLSVWDISSVTDMGTVFHDITLSTANYEAILIGWEAQAVQNGVFFSGGLSRYSPAAAAARQRLITDHSWTITDGGPE